VTDHDQLAALVSRLVRDGHLDEDLLDELLPAGSPTEIFDHVQALRTLVADMAGPAGGRPTAIEGRISEAFRQTDMATEEEIASGADPADTYDEPPTTRRYALERELARGGTGAVWLAQDLLLQRPVALKVLLPESQTSEDIRNRFVFEAQMTGRLGHPGILPVYDVGKLADGRWFYTMQLVGGRSLAEVLSGLRGGDPELLRSYPLKRLLHVFSQTCLTVAFAHDHGMIHRDLKPENVLLGEYGEVWVADWGLAKVLTGEEQASMRTGRKTVPGAVIGTLHFMSPEQIRGDVDALTPATDVWSLGVILFEILTLQLPFEAPTPVGLMFKIVSEEVPDAADAAPTERNVPQPMAALCREAMTRSVDRRVLTSRELADRVAGFLDGVEEQARRQERCRELLERAFDLRDLYMRLREEMLDERISLQREKEMLKPSTPESERTELYRREQALEEKALEAEAVYSKTVQVASQGLDEWETDKARDLLAELFWQRAQDAVRARDAVSELHFRTLVEQHDSGRFTDRLASTGTLAVRSEVQDLIVRIERQVPYGPLLQAELVPPTGGEERVPVGSYVVVAEAPGRLPARVPVIVEGNQFLDVLIDPPVAFDGHEEFVYISPGPVSIGGDEGAARSLPEQKVEVGPLLIGRHPITLGAYCRFLDALAEQDPEAAKARAPRSSDGSVTYLDYDVDTRSFRVPTEDRDGDAWEPSWPALMIDWYDAAAYCEWRSMAEGLVYRLPTDVEWEVAARGADRRIYPWGNGFDPSFCRMVDSGDGRPLPAPVGQYPRDCSPFGVRDMAGLVAEWTCTPADGSQEQYIQRGGTFASPSEWCRAATRRSNFANWNTPHFGFRIVREL